MNLIDRLYYPIQDRFDSQYRVLRARFWRLEPRERWMVSVTAVLAVIVIVYLAIWLPLMSAHKRRVDSIDYQRDIAQRLERAAAELAANPQARRAPPPAAPADMSLLALVDQAAKSGTLGKAVDQLTPQSENEVRVRITAVPFDALLRWIRELSDRRGLTVSTLDVERASASGTVNAQLTVMRPVGP